MEKIVVSIRVRPLNKQEASKGSPWRVSSNAISLCNVSTGAVVPGQTYVFDSVFGMEEKTLDLHEAHTKPIIGSAVKGINGTVFAYGQTSSGKTFTMRGSSVEPGIIPLSVRDVFFNIQQAEDREFLLRVSYMEIYNEEINDLLAPENRKLQVHENLERGIFVAGLREEIVSCPEQVLQLLEYGEAHRHIGETNMNLYSSRSHTIFRMVIESRDRSQDDSSQPAAVCDAVRVSVLNLVDLAGSERVAKTGAEGARLKEGSHINKSLMTLGTVINKLSEGVESQGGHVPYRDSKLTRILQPALGGNARTVIICNITPAMMHVDETKGTLQFASRAIRVTNCAQVNEIVTDAALLKRQKREIEELRNKLQESHSEHLEEEILSLRNAMLKIELERERMALELQDKAARERRMKEQIENLSTLVLNSAVDDRQSKSVKKTNRRETWCPRLTTSQPAVEVQSLKASSSISTKRERNLPLPPPFESLKEEDDVHMKDAKEELEDCRLNETQSDYDRMRYVGDRRHKLSARLHANEEELLDLQARFQSLHCDYEVALAEIEKLRSDNDKLKASSNTATRQNEGSRRCKSLDGSQTDTSIETIAELQNQVQTLETEKYYMERELDSRIEHAKSQTNSAKQVLEGLYDELKESNEQIQILTDRNMVLEQEKEEMSRSLTQLATAFEDLNSEVNNSMVYAAECIETIMIEARHIRPSLQCMELHELKVALEHNVGASASGENTKVQEVLELTKVKDDLIMELTDVYYKLEEEKAVSASRLTLIQEKEKQCSELQSALAQIFSEKSDELEAVQILEAKLTHLEQRRREREDECDAIANLKIEELHKELRLIEERAAVSEAASQEQLQKRLEEAQLVEELTKEKEKLVMELMDVHYKLEEEKTISASRQRAIEEKGRLCAAATEKAAQLSSEVESMEKTLNAKFDRLVQAVTAKANELELTLQQEVHKLLEDLERINEKLVSAEADIRTAKADKRNEVAESVVDKPTTDKLMEDLNTALRRCETLEMHCEHLKKKADEQQLQNGFLADRIDQLKIREGELSEADVKSRTELEQACSMYQIMLDNLTMELEVANKKFKQLEEQYTIVKENEDNQSLQSKQLEDRIDQLKIRERELSEADVKSRTELEQARSMYQIMLDNLAMELEVAYKKFKQLEEQYTIVKENEEKQSLQSKQLEDRILQLQKDLSEAAETFKREMNVAIEKSNICEAELRQDLNTAVARCKKLEEQYAIFNKTENEQANMRLNERISELQNELSAASDHKNELARELNFITSKGKLLEEQYLVATEKETERNLQLTERTGALQKELMEADAFRTELRRELDVVSDKCKQLEEQYAVARERENEHCLQNQQLLERVSELHKELLKDGDLYKAELKGLLVSKTKFQLAFDAMFARAEVFEGRLEDARWEFIEFRDKATRAQRALESTLASSKLEIADLKLEIEKETVKKLEVQKVKLESQKDNCTTKRKASNTQGPASATKMKKMKDTEMEKHATSEDVDTPCSKLSNKSTEEAHVRRSPLSPLNNMTLSAEVRKTKKWLSPNENF